MISRACALAQAHLSIPCSHTSRAKLECWLGSFVVFQGILSSIAKKPIFCDFFRKGEGGGFGLPAPPDSAN